MTTGTAPDLTAERVYDVIQTSETGEGLSPDQVRELCAAEGVTPRGSTLPGAYLRKLSGAGRIVNVCSQYRPRWRPSSGACSCSCHRRGGTR